MTDDNTLVDFRAVRLPEGIYIHLDTVLAIIRAKSSNPEAAAKDELEIKRAIDRAFR